MFLQEPFEAGYIFLVCRRFFNNRKGHPMFGLKNQYSVILTFLLLFLLPLTGFAEGKEIIILHTNDIHCGVSDNLGIDRVAQYKKELQKKGHPVALMFRLN